MRNFLQQPTPVPPQVELPQNFPEIPAEIIDRYGDSARDWQRRLDDFWTRTNQAIQQAQDQTARQINSNVVFNVDSFLIYANGVPTAMFALDASGVRLGNVLTVNTPGRKVYIGAGNLANDDTPFYIDTLGNFSLGASLVWDPDTDTLTITGIINATSGTIGGFDIGADYIRDTANSFGLASTITGGDDVRLWAGAAFASRGTAPFRVTEAGNLVATSATISGTITATSGTIGGFNVGSDYIRDTANSFGLASTVTGGDDVRFWAGASFANRATAPFRIQESGQSTCTILSVALAGTVSGYVLFNPGTAPSGSSDGKVYMTSAGFFARTVAGTFKGDQDVSTTGTPNFASIGATTPGTGAFTTLSASSTVSGTGFSTYLASPPAIGSGTPGTGAFTTLSTSGNAQVGGTTDKTTIFSGSGTGLTIQAGAAPNLAVWDTTNSTYVGYFGQVNADTYIGSNAGNFIVQANGATIATLSSTGLAVTGVVDINGTAASATASHLQLGSSTQSTIGANGAASALTANPLGYLSAYLGTTHIIIPYYNA